MQFQWWHWGTSNTTRMLMTISSLLVHLTWMSLISQPQILRNYRTLLTRNSVCIIHNPRLLCIHPPDLLWIVVWLAIGMLTIGICSSRHTEYYPCSISPVSITNHIVDIVHMILWIVLIPIVGSYWVYRISIQVIPRWDTRSMELGMEHNQISIDSIAMQIHWCRCTYN